MASIRPNHSRFLSLFTVLTTAGIGVAFDIPAVAAEQPSTAEQRLHAARRLNFDATEHLKRTECDFTFVLWQNSTDGTRAKTEALGAYVAGKKDGSDPCTRFIITGLHQAVDKDQADAIADADKAKKERERRISVLKALAIAATEDLLKQDTKSFIFTIWERSKPNSQVRLVAGEALKSTATEKDWDDFLNVKVYEARLKDIDNEVSDPHKDKKREKRLAAARAALGTDATDSMADLTDEQFLGMLCATEARQKTAVCLDAAKAQATGDPKKYEEYILTGIYVAIQRDKDDAYRKERDSLRLRVREIRDTAKYDGYLPEVLQAAEHALQADTVQALREFLYRGYPEARLKDRVTARDGAVVQFQNIASGRCAQTVAEGMDINSTVEIWDCGRDYAKQRFKLFDSGDQKTFFIQNTHSFACLGVQNNSNDNEAPVGQLDCDQSTNQKWEFIDSGDGMSVRIRNVRSGKALAVAESGTKAGSPIVQQTNNSQSHPLQWRILEPQRITGAVAITAQRFAIQGVESDRCLQTIGDGLQEGENFELWSCDPHFAKQIFIPVNHGGTVYQLRSERSGMCLGVEPPASARNGLELVQTGCDAPKAKSWSLTPSSQNGAYVIKNVETGKVADVRDHNTHDGSVVHQWDHLDTPNQQWKILPR